MQAVGLALCFVVYAVLVGGVPLGAIALGRARRARGAHRGSWLHALTWCYFIVMVPISMMAAWGVVGVDGPVLGWLLTSLPVITLAATPLIARIVNDPQPSERARVPPLKPRPEAVFE